jgi:lipopolysaccharide export system protein LptA
MIRRNFHLLLLPLTLAAAFFYFLWSAKPEGGRPSPEAARSDLIASDTDQKLQKFKLTGFDEKGKSAWNLEGDSAKIDPGQTVFLDQNVTLRLKDDTVIKSDHVQWSQDGGTLRTQEIVTVEHESVFVRGRGAYGRPADGYIQLNRDIEMTMNDSTKLVCQGPMKIFYNQNLMHFYRKVKVTDQRGILSANRMDVYFDPDKKKIHQIVAIGNVVIERGQDTTRSQRAIYSLDTGSVRLEGNPEITLHKSGGTGILDGALRN